MDFVLLFLSVAVAVAGFYAVKRSQPPARVRVRALSGRRRDRD